MVMQQNGDFFGRKQYHNNSPGSPTFSIFQLILDKENKGEASVLTPCYMYENEENRTLSHQRKFICQQVCSPHEHCLDCTYYF
jgi:hypothetical protein